MTVTLLKMQAWNFVLFCTGRAWILTDTGTTKDGERIYQFVHRTFLEYYAADHLVHTHNTITELLGELLQHIKHSEWREITDIAIQKMSQRSDSAADELLSMLLAGATESDEPESNNLLYAIHSLEFIVPTPGLIERVISTAVRRCIDLELAHLREATDAEGLEIIEVFIGHFMPQIDHFFVDFLFAAVSAAPENRASIADALKKILPEYLIASDDYSSLVATEFGLNLDQISSISSRGNAEGPASIETRRYLESISDHIFETCAEHILKTLCPKYVRVALDAHYMGKLSIKDLITFHGSQVVFRQHSYLLYTFIYNDEIILHLLKDLCDERTSPERYAVCLEDLQSLADVLPSSLTPWVTITEEESDYFSYMRICHRTLANLDNKSLFAVFIGLVFMYERSTTISGFSDPGEFNDFLPDYFHWVLTARRYNRLFDDDEEAERAQGVEAELKKGGFTDAQKKFIQNWIDDRLYLFNIASRW